MFKSIVLHVGGKKMPRVQVLKCPSCGAYIDADTGEGIVSPKALKPVPPKPPEKEEEEEETPEPDPEARRFGEPA